MIHPYSDSNLLCRRIQRLECLQSVSSHPCTIDLGLFVRVHVDERIFHGTWYDNHVYSSSFVCSPGMIYHHLDGVRVRNHRCIVRASMVVLTLSTLLADRLILVFSRCSLFVIGFRLLLYSICLVPILLGLILSFLDQLDML